MRTQSSQLATLLNTFAKTDQYIKVQLKTFLYASEGTKRFAQQLCVKCTWSWDGSKTTALSFQFTMGVLNKWSVMCKLLLICIVPARFQDVQPATDLTVEQRLYFKDAWRTNNCKEVNFSTTVQMQGGDWREEETQKETPLLSPPKGKDFTTWNACPGPAHGQKQSCINQLNQQLGTRWPLQPGPEINYFGTSTHH